MDPNFYSLGIVQASSFSFKFYLNLKFIKKHCENTVREVLTVPAQELKGSKHALNIAVKIKVSNLYNTDFTNLICISETEIP